MAAHEHHAQLVVAQLLIEVFVLLRSAMPSSQFARQLLGLIREDGVAPDCVQRLVAGNAEQPPARVLRNAGMGPLLESLQKRILNHLLRQIQMRGSEQARQVGDHLPRRSAEQMVDKIPDVVHCRLQPVIRSTSRTSIVPPYSRCGQSRDTSSAFS